MKKLFVIWSLFIVCPPLAAHAQELYVSGYRELMLRTGPSRDNKIIAVLKTGNAVKMVRSAGDDYYLVALPDGRQGDVLKGYVTEEPPAAYRAQVLAERFAQQKGELGRLREENERLQKAQSETQRVAAEQGTQLRNVTVERDRLRDDSFVSNFLAGAGVLLIGWLLGWTRLRLRRRLQRRPGLSL